MIFNVTLTPPVVTQVIRYEPALPKESAGRVSSPLALDLTRPRVRALPFASIMSVYDEDDFTFEIVV